MTKEEMELVDEIRRLWFYGESIPMTPIEMLNSLPIQIRSLINIIDRLQEVEIPRAEVGSYIQ